MNNETINNMRRIAYALYCAAGDAAAMQQIARILRYDPKQLQRDIADLDTVTAELARAARDEDE